MVYALREYKRLMHDHGTLKIENKDTLHKVIRGTDINKDNEKNSYILLKIIDEEKGVVVRGGKFEEDDVDKLLNIYSINEESKSIFAKCVFNIVQITNDWIKHTGNYFIFNLRQIENSKN